MSFGEDRSGGPGRNPASSSPNEREVKLYDKEGKAFDLAALRAGRPFVLFFLVRADAYG